MKTLFCIFIIALTTLCQAQQTEVLIIGTIHHFQEEYKKLQQFETVQDDLVSFSPDIICTESISIDDSLSLAEIWPNTLEKADLLQQALVSGKYDSIATPLQLKAAQLWSNYDFWNAYYYWDSLAVNQTPGPFGKYHRNLSNSEYGNLVFPVARKLGITLLQNIDFRDGENIFLENQNKAFKQLLFHFKLKPIRTYIRLQKKYKKAEKAGAIIPFINSPEFQGSFGNLIDELPNKLKKSEEAQFVRDYWHNRNKIMAERIHTSAVKLDAKKVLVTVGSAHVGHIKYYLQQLGYSVLTYGELLSEKSKAQ